MAIISAKEWLAATNQTATGSALTALQFWCGMVDRAIRRIIRPFVPEPTTYSNVVLDAPPREVLRLPARPVRAITSLYYREDANGDPSLFTSDYLLTQYTDYYMPVDPTDGYSRSGLVYRRGFSFWGMEYRRPPTRLGSEVTPIPGALLANFTAGPTAVPDDIFAAAVLAVSMCLKRKEAGMPATSESWNGYSISYPAPFLMAFLTSADVAQLLLPYQTVNIAAG